MLHRILGVLLGCTCSVLVWAGVGEDRINSFLDGVESMQASFEQTLYDEEMNRLEDSRGTMYLQRPGRFRWDYVDPYPQTIISNGNTLLLYDSELAQVTVKALDQGIENTPSLLLSAEEPLENHFEISEVTGEGPEVWVELVPRSPDATFSRLRVLFVDDLLQGMELVDSFGQTTVLRFFNLEKNLPFDDGLFEFEVPDGVDVVGDVAVQ